MGNLAQKEYSSNVPVCPLFPFLQKEPNISTVFGSFKTVLIFLKEPNINKVFASTGSTLTGSPCHGKWWHFGGRRKPQQVRCLIFWLSSQQRLARSLKKSCQLLLWGNCLFNLSFLAPSDQVGPSRSDLPEDKRLIPKPPCFNTCLKMSTSQGTPFTLLRISLLFTFRLISLARACIFLFGLSKIWLRNL